MKDKAQRMTLLPGPDDDEAADDIEGGDVFPDDDPDGEEFDPDEPEWLDEAITPPAPDDEPPPRDKQPGPAARPRPSRSTRTPRETRKSPGAAAPRVTAAVRKDVEAKISFGITVMGAAWQVRDEPCGGTLLHQEPAITKALARAVCNSPDLLVWFTTGGSYVLWLDVIMALIPLGQCVYAHHVRHAQMVPADPQQPPQADPSQAYAA